MNDEALINNAHMIILTRNVQISIMLVCKYESVLVQYANSQIGNKY